MHVVTATDEALAEVIEDWLRLEIPEDETLASQMTHLAMMFRADGASVGETCEWTSVLVRSWLQHPSHGCPSPHLRLVGASETS
ncbi:MAG TPA: hypothetical protein VNG12_18660 [Acidimicrobiales bacterium]|nr:hypothetical protein [Acidimicrobiales bacterium]